MEPHRVLIVGESLFAETLPQMLARANSVEIVGSAPSAEAALPLIHARRPDVVIVAEAGDRPPATLGRVLAAYPHLAIILADLSADHIQVITSQHVSAHPADLLAAIAALPKWS